MLSHSENILCSLYMHNLIGIQWIQALYYNEKILTYYDEQFLTLILLTLCVEIIFVLLTRTQRQSYLLVVFAFLHWLAWSRRQTSFPRPGTKLWKEPFYFRVLESIWAAIKYNCLEWAIDKYRRFSDIIIFVWRSWLLYSTLQGNKSWT